jgi:chemotaxis protein MotB
VAYADFVTAMMAFFLLMWLLNATTEKQRKGLSDYFNPTIPVNRISGGGDGAVWRQQRLSPKRRWPIPGPGRWIARPILPAVDQDEGDDAGKGVSGEGRAQSELQDVEKALFARGGESNTMEQLLRHVVTKVTDEGLVIELFDLPDAPLFLADTDEPSQVALAIADLLSDVLNLTSNEIAVSGHLRAHPVTLIDNPVWELSSLRAQKHAGGPGRGQASTRARMQSACRAMPTASLRSPIPAAERNNRIEVILLRRNR